MPAYSSTTSSSYSSSSSVSSSSPKSSSTQKRYSCSAYVKKYTEMIILGVNRTYALEKLHDINCPMSVFEKCDTERVLAKHVGNMYECQYQVSLLHTKFETLRRRELRDAQKKFDKKGELAAHLAFKPEFVELHKKEMEERSQESINRLFEQAIGRSKETTVIPRVKPDYSKFKITKRNVKKTF
ncbi:hypothetical protein GCK72_011987 [Caenorhabditis remanei]|uniref:Uncharacterized protein n=1 Tax=Caenorhabditis remanei TaxID=31234 RepID=A0A6A5GJQ1_CAERE|nr:hypothetical protein GCK72_011987 [Caenorhabditis remanei]KAF1755537.1 hypothetical protein GCK72_011987 [Caenorhabditis remanei]